jgi:hypothetical protein
VRERPSLIPIKTTGKITVLYFLILKFLRRKQNTKHSAPNGSKRSPKLFHLNFSLKAIWSASIVANLP